MAEQKNLVWLIAGLGNPGPRYQNTPHNIGFLVVDELCRRHGGNHGFRTRDGGDYASCSIGAQRSVLLKPMEFMNNSGFAVQRFVQFHGCKADHVIIVHDEIDLPFAQLRLKEGGGHGGHNGLRSIQSQLGSHDFLRVRIGVGKPEKQDGSDGTGSVTHHVLGAFASEMQGEVERLVQTSADATEAILSQGMRAAMNKFNGKSRNN